MTAELVCSIETIHLLKWLIPDALNIRGEKGCGSVRATCSFSRGGAQSRPLSIKRRSLRDKQDNIKLSSETTGPRVSFSGRARAPEHSARSRKKARVTLLRRGRCVSSAVVRWPRRDNNVIFSTHRVLSVHAQISRAKVVERGRQETRAHSLWAQRQVRDKERERRRPLRSLWAWRPLSGRGDRSGAETGRAADAVPIRDSRDQTTLPLKRPTPSLAVPRPRASRASRLWSSNKSRSLRACACSELFGRAGRW